MLLKFIFWVSQGRLSRMARLPLSALRLVVGLIPLSFFAMGGSSAQGTENPNASATHPDPSGASTNAPNRAQMGVPPSVTNSSSGTANPTALLAEGDAIMDSKEDAQFAPKAIDRYQSALANGAEPFEVHWRVARAYFWWAESDKEKSKKAEYGKAGMQAADLARDLRPERVEGHYYYAICTGAYASGAGIVRVLWEGLQGKFVSAAEKAESINPKFEYGGPLILMGRYYYALPWPGRDLEKSRKYYEQALQVYQENPRVHYYLAQTLLKLGEKEKAKEELELAISSKAPDKLEVQWQERAKKLRGTL